MTLSCRTAPTPNGGYAGILKRLGQPSVCMAGRGQEAPEGDNDPGRYIRLADQHVPMSERAYIVQCVRSAGAVNNRDGGMITP